MVTFEPGRATTAAASSRPLEPRARRASRSTQLDLVPPGARGYATCGDADARAFAGHPPRDLERARALLVNRARGAAC